MMKIGLDVTPLCVPQSGVGTYTLNLLEHLRLQPGNQVVPLAHRPIIVTREGVPPAVIPPFESNKTLWMQMVLPFRLRSLGIQVAHFTNSVAPLFGPCPTVVTIHDMTLWLYPEHHYRRRLLAMRPFIPLGVRRASAIITVSNSAKSDIVRLLEVAPEKVHVIYEAADPLFRPLPPDEVRAVLAALGLPSPYILYVGTLEPRKNLERLVEAFARLVSTGAPHRLVLAGQRGWKESPLFDAIERLGVRKRVHLYSQLPAQDLAALYNGAQFLAFPSLYEGFGLPIVEAMACGTPVLTSRRGSLSEIAGDAAHYVNPTEVDSIFDGLQRMVNDPPLRGALRSAGLARAATFSWERAALETRAVYDEALHRPRLVQRTATGINERRLP